ncbi:hypothetical protein BRARA_J00853, partial [Brassica rapa]
MLFNEPQLLIVYRVALEIDMVYAPTPEERAALPRLTVDDMIAIQDGDTIYIDDGRNHAPTEEVLHGEPMDVDNLHRAFPNLTPPNVQRHGIPLEVEPLNQIQSLPPIEEEVTEQHFDANGISETQPNYEVNVTAAPRPTNGVLSLPIGPNLRVNAPTIPTPVVVVHDDEGSYTGSSDGINNVDNNRGVAPPIPIGETVINISQALEQGCSKTEFRNTRSSPEGMVMECISGTCQWRVYATKMKTLEKFEVRKAQLQHTCSVDDRVGYERQATHGVIGELMKSRYVGIGGAPRPKEIMQVMLGDHDVNISYWKAWQSREVALDYAKGSSCASYMMLPDYLDRLVLANPGTLAEMVTEFEGGVGHMFKYMFLALAASVSGFKQMCSVIIIDGTHMRGKYGGCLLTASAHDGNYQVFPLAMGVVDSENDKAWEWFFKMLLQFIPNNEDVVFVSDRHSSIYYGISKVYPGAQHCACILHLKRNIRTYFKNKHLSFLVGKAARAFSLADFYGAFNEIKLINASCAEYLEGIGFEHWARVHFGGKRYDVMTSNIAESWNSVLREAREYPILALV